MNFLITRHPGALAWLQTQVSPPFTQLTHLNTPDIIQPGDTVYGTLPVQLIADICSRGGHYFHLEVAVPAHLRGQELCAMQLNHLGAALVEYFALQRIPDSLVMALAEEREQSL